MYSEQQLSLRALPLLLGKSLHEVWNSYKHYALFAVGGLGVLLQAHAPLFVFATLLIMTLLTFGHYRKYRYRITPTEIALEQGIFRFQRVVVKISNIERIETRQNPFERLFKLSTIELFSAGSAAPAITLSYLTHQQSTSLSALVRNNEQTTEYLRYRWLYSVFTGKLYPYLTWGIVAAIPLLMLLNFFQQPPASDPLAAKTAVTDTLELGLIPLLVNAFLMVPFYVFVCTLGKAVLHCHDYVNGQFHLTADGTIKGRVGLFNQRSWQVNASDIQSYRVDTNRLFEWMGRYTVTINTTNASTSMMIIPGIDTRTLNKLLALKSLPPLAREQLTFSGVAALIPTMKSLLLFAAGIAILAYLCPEHLLPELSSTTNLFVILVVSLLLLFFTALRYTNNGLFEKGGALVVSTPALSRIYHCFNASSVHSQSIKRLPLGLVMRTINTTCFCVSLISSNKRSTL